MHAADKHKYHVQVQID